MTNRALPLLRQHLTELATVAHQRDLALRQAIAELATLVGDHLYSAEEASDGFSSYGTPGDRAMAIADRVFPGDQVATQSDLTTPYDERA